MKTIVLDRPGHFTLVEREATPAPEAGEAIVNVRRIGVCGTDLHAFKGEHPFISCPRVLGHEFAGEIVSIGENPEGLRAGDRCAIEPYLNCGSCIACRRGRTNCCARLRLLGVHIDGAMSERIRVPAAKLHRSDKLSLDELALIEPLSIGAHAVARARIEAGEFALVVGAGPIGLAVIQFAQLAGARLIVTDIDRERLDFAARHYRIEAAIEAGEGARERIEELTAGEMPTVVFEATGNQRSMNASFDLPAQGGRIVLVGLIRGELTFDDAEAHRRELTILCSRNATREDFQHVRLRLEAGEIEIGHWITHRLAFAEVESRFANLLDPQSRFIKAVIEV